MLQEERLAEVLRLLREKGTVKIQELTERFGVTRETVRRDLYELERLGHVRKVHGGATLHKTGVEPAYSERADSLVAEKQAIAKRCADLVEAGDSLFIDVGTTALLFARQLHAHRELRIITNSVPVAMELAHHPSAKVILCGGFIRPGDLSVSGAPARHALETFFADKAFIGVGGLSANGLTDYHVEEADLRRLMMQRAKETIAMADSTKLGVTAFHRVAAAEELSVLVTDREADPAMLQFLAESGVQVIVADGETDGGRAKLNSPRKREGSSE
ncbi:DeoR/GlpR transcriptional regulator [Paenibacillus antri]|uniref:DeoR/GlpR transcriptional regulator n=1 Tax=Paenibacillus antri TaxID=2582848 RepID=A0A5R9GFX9_9BACL|nr:DeoR/GlpR family DNA-binding transcription regulator [Paenibacillus antri]TLS51603.1 DeoR/GlpR transcriptional regulator [Paenibacillus antri]